MWRNIARNWFDESITETQQRPAVEALDNDRREGESAGARSTYEMGDSLALRNRPHVNGCRPGRGQTWDWRILLVAGMSAF